jgi:hypothetical protein
MKPKDLRLFVFTFSFGSSNKPDKIVSDLDIYSARGQILPSLTILARTQKHTHIGTHTHRDTDTHRHTNSHAHTNVHTLTLAFTHILYFLAWISCNSSMVLILVVNDVL